MLQRAGESGDALFHRAVARLVGDSGEVTLRMSFGCSNFEPDRLPAPQPGPDLGARPAGLTHEERGGRRDPRPPSRQPGSDIGAIDAPRLAKTGARFGILVPGRK